MHLLINDLNMHVELAGLGHPLLLLHGFTGGATTWAALATQLSPYRRTLAVDLIGHGQSAAPAEAERYRMERCVADLLALLDALEIARADVLGYSMGGRVALQLAAAAPERVGALLLESSSPGLASPAERAARAAADADMAAAIERDGLAAFVAQWERLPLFASQAALPAELRERQRAQRLHNRPLGLANSLRGMGTGQQTSLWDRLPDLRMPTLLLAGALDQKYCTIAQRMAAQMPNARLALVPNAGHTIHLEQPGLFADTVLEFLQSLPG